jgi:tRNA-splicing ligase RtcB (3'-phosphate/5'-hydroxy nucleic acid ligase)
VVTDAHKIRVWEPVDHPFEPGVMQQVYHVAALPITEGVRLMPDGHQGIGGPVGAVVATRGAIVPAVTGVDIGCGMLAARTSLNAERLDKLAAIRAAIEDAVPVGGPGVKGSWSETRREATRPPSVRTTWDRALATRYEAIIAAHPKIRGVTWEQLGSLGTGNHFIEVCLDEMQRVWIMLHSGSRGVGNRIGTYFIDQARRAWEKNPERVALPDRDLAWLTEGTPLFEDYIEALTWAQDYALHNRALMLHLVSSAMQTALGPFDLIEDVVQCHHNYATRNGEVWITRKGAIDASAGRLGIIPGSMGAKSFIVRGRGNPASYQSSSHGAGRRMSRGQAKRTITVDQHVAATVGVECRKDARVLDESPAAYKSIDAVMAAQRDLVEVVHTLKQVVCVKG